MRITMIAVQDDGIFTATNSAFVVQANTNYIIIIIIIMYIHMCIYIGLCTFNITYATV